jgi:hypothetical protein
METSLRIASCRFDDAKPWVSYDHLRREATLLAGGNNDLAQRAAV